MLPGDLSSPRLRLPSAEKQGRVWSLLRGNVIDPVEWCSPAQHGERKRPQERARRRGQARGVPWLLISRRKKEERGMCGVRNDSGVWLMRCCVCVCVCPGESASQASPGPRTLRVEDCHHETLCVCVCVLQDSYSFSCLSSTHTHTYTRARSGGFFLEYKITDKK